MIAIDREHQLIRLDTPHTTYVLGLLDGKYLTHLYYGAKLGAGDLSALFFDPDAAPVPSACPREKAGFLDAAPFEYGTSGIGDFREPALVVRSADGQEGCELFYQSARVIPGKPKLVGLPASFGDQSEVSTLEVDLVDPVLDLAVTLQYSVFDDVDVITRSARITNQGKAPVELLRCLSFSLDLPAGDYDMITLQGAWAREHEIERRPVGFGGMEAGSIRGIPGHDANPFFFLADRGTNERQGSVCGFVLVYSGNFLAKVQRTQFGSIRAVLGIHPARFTWHLAPGETLQAPEALLSWSGTGIGTLSRTYHDLIRRHLIRSKYVFEKRPVLVNNWEATYFDFDEEKLLAIAAAAKKAGIEMLVTDDGWFGTHRDTDSGCLGDWLANQKKFPEGFPAFVEKLHKMGLLAGLWFEPESISKASELYEKHPDWCLKISGRTPTLCRDQWIADLSNPACEAYLTGAILDLVRRSKIDYIKWDMNRPLADLGSAALPPERQGEIAHRHVLAVYRMQERLLAEFPDLLLENCAGGGSRFDAGMLYYSPQIWCSDDMDPAERLKIQEGTELVYPVSTMGAHVGASPYGITSRVSDFDTRAKCAMMGTFGYELDLTKLSEEDFSKIPAQVATYRKLQELEETGDYYRIASYRENGWLDAVEIAAKDGKEAFVLAVQVLTQPNEKSTRLYLQGLRPNARYEVEGRIFPGDILMQAGYPLAHKIHDLDARIIRIREVEA